MMTCVAFAPHPHLLPASREKETSTLVHVLSEPCRRGTKGSASKLATPSPRLRGEGEDEGQSHKDTQI
jgi:hypothetical protein